MALTRLFIGLLAALLLAACGGGASPSPLPAATPAPAGVTPTPAPTSAPAPTAVTPTPAPIGASAAVETAPPPIWKYVNSGWISPRDEAPGVFAQELRAFVITSQEELDAFQESALLRVSRGSQTSLGRIQFPGSILLAAYYLWRPLQGDPLSVVGFSLNGGRAEVHLELEESAQGKEYPYLLAPMAMVAIDRSHFPAGEPIDFVFYLDGDPLATVAAKFE